MDKAIARIVSSIVLFVTVLSLMAACSQTQQPPTNTPTAEPPTATLIPPYTPSPPTNTAEPTATSTSTATPAPTVPPVLPTYTPIPTKAVAPKSTQTKSAAAVPPIVVSAKPSTLQKSNDQAYATAQAIVGLIDQMINGGGSELCAPLIEKYQSLRAAPTYDLTGESNEIHQAYDLYRQGSSLLDTRSATILGCGQGGGPIGGVELGLVRRAAGLSVDLFGRARDFINSAPGISTLSPFEAAIARPLHSAQGITGILDGLAALYQKSMQFKTNSSVCVQAVAYHNAIEAFTMDPASQSSSIQSAYQLYRDALNQYETEISSFPKMCAAGGATLSTVSLGNMHGKLITLIITLYRAQNILK